MFKFNRFIIAMNMFVLVGKSSFLYADFSTVTPISENHEVIEQLQGDYPPMLRQESLPLAAIQRAWDQADPSAGIYVIEHQKVEHIKLRVREHMTTIIVFPYWEKIDNIIVGDKSVVTAELLNPNVVLVMPQHYIGTDTDLKILSCSGHIYVFYVRHEGYNSKHIPDLVVYVKSTQPKFKDYQCSKDPTKQAEDYLQPTEINISAMNFSYCMSGDQRIAPKRVFSNGQLTWLDYGESIHTKTLPAVYQRLDNVDSPVNVTKQGRMLVVHTSGELTLRHGKRFTCIYPCTEK